MIRVLYIDHARVLGGAEHSLLGLLRHLGTSVEAVVAGNPGAFLEQAQSLGANVQAVPLPRLRRNWRAPLDLWEGVQRLRSVVKNRGVDLIHSNTMRAGMYASVTAALSRRPLVWHARDIYPEAWFRHWMCQNSGRVIATSRFVASDLPCRQKVQIIPNGVDLEIFEPERPHSHFRRQLGIPQEAPLLGCVGRLRKWKGQELFLQAAAQISKSFPGAHYAIIGGQIFPEEGNEYPERLNALARTLGLSGRVHFSGHQTDMASVYGSLDLLLHTSLNEPFGRVLIEAMAMEVPVVGFASGAVPEIVRTGEAGFLVPFGSVSTLADRSVELLRQPAMARQMGQSGRRCVEDHFEIGETTRLVVDLYRGIMEGRV